MRILFSLLLAAVLALPSTSLTQPRLSSVGISFGSTSDFGRGITPGPEAAPRQFNLGVPVRIQLTDTAPVALSALGTVEWSYAPAVVRGSGLTQFAAGPELHTTWGAGDLRLAGLVGLIQRRGDAIDAATHRQYGFEAGVGFTRGTWRVGYGYRSAWVQDVPHAYPPCASCRYPADVPPPTTEQYDRHALSLSWQR